MKRGTQASIPGFLRLDLRASAASASTLGEPGSFGLQVARYGAPPVLMEQEMDELVNAAHATCLAQGRQRLLWRVLFRLSGLMGGLGEEAEGRFVAPIRFASTHILLYN